MLKKCEYCHKDFEATRSTAKFCSSNHKIYFQRDGSLPEQVEPISLESIEEQIEITKEVELDQKIKNIQEEADKQTSRDYLGSMKFGGVSVVSKGAVTDHKYFNFNEIKDKYIFVIAKDWGMTKEQILDNRDKLLSYQDIPDYVIKGTRDNSKLLLDFQARLGIVSDEDVPYNDMFLTDEERCILYKKFVMLNRGFDYSIAEAKKDLIEIPLRRAGLRKRK